MIHLPPEDGQTPSDIEESMGGEGAAASDKPFVGEGSQMRALFTEMSRKEQGGVSPSHKPAYTAEGLGLSPIAQEEHAMLRGIGADAHVTSKGTIKEINGELPWGTVERLVGKERAEAIKAWAPKFAQRKFT